MTRDELYESLGKKLQNASEEAGTLEKLANGVERVFDPTMWLGIITALVEIFRGCRNPATAKASVRDGSTATYRAMLQVGRNEKGYKGRELRDWAYKATQEARKLTDEEFDGIIRDADEIPQPPPVEGGFWPLWMVALGLLIPSASYSQEVSRGFWPIDEIQNHRLMVLESKVSQLEGKPVIVIGKALDKNTAICNCKGANKGVCYCLKSGVQCKCTATKGSIWNLTPEGKAIGKTGAYANPQTGQPLAATITPNVQVSLTVKPAQSAIQTPQYTYQTVCNGRSCRRLRVRLW